LNAERSRSGAVTASGESATPKSGALRKGKVMTARDATTLDRLFETIGTRARADPATSYTAQLLRQGTEQVAKKLGEEALETALAAVAGRHAGVVSESADLLYHLLVLWAATSVTPAEVWAELARRESASGLAEKARRPPP
jgi:phosphoribosyl-ATP pyrophosphohydrolase